MDSQDDESVVCEEPSVTSEDEVCAFSNECTSPDGPKTLGAISYHLDGFAEISVTLWVTGENETLECGYSGTATWIPEPNQDEDIPEEETEEAEENNG